MSERQKRVVTGAALVLAVVVLLAVNGVLLGIAVVACIAIAVFEEYKALTQAGHRPVSWPTWAGLVLTIPLIACFGTKMLLPIMACICLATMICVTFRKEPKLVDMLMSLLPLTTVALPGVCMIDLAQTDPKTLQVVLLVLTVAVPTVGDTFAYFVGSRVGGPKFCPAVSPNKTISGAVAGLVGSVLTAFLTVLLARCFCDAATISVLPTLWHALLLGVVGGVAGQMGDLFASMVKRHCGIKDYSDLFPGHGGMLDRMDSILFMSVVVFIYRMMIVL